MATQIQSQLISGVYFQSGLGIPNHIADVSTIYINREAPEIYQNQNGVSTWGLISGSTGGSSGGGGITGFTYNPITNTLTIDSSGATFSVVINEFSGLTISGDLSATTISATTYYGDGSNLTGINSNDTYVTGGTPDNDSKIYTFTNNTGGTFNVIGLNDTYVTGGTYFNSIATFTNSTGGTFDVSGFETGTIGGTGTTNYIPKWESDTGQTNSQIIDDGTSIGVNKATGLSAKLHVLGNPAQTAFRVDADTTTEALQVRSNGRVGVLTPLTSIDWPLVVTGGARFGTVIVSAGNNLSGIGSVTATSTILGSFLRVGDFAMTAGGAGILLFKAPSTGPEMMRIHNNAGTKAVAINVGEIPTPNTIFQVKGVNNLSTDFTVKLQDSGGTNNFVVRNDGNTGIGVASPEAKLHVSGSVRFDSLSGDPNIGDVLTAGDTGGTLTWSTPTYGTIGGTGTTNYIPKWESDTGQTNSQIIDNGLNIGIGTDTPSQFFHVEKNQDALTRFLLANSTDGTAARVGFQLSGSVGTTIMDLRSPSYSGTYSNRFLFRTDSGIGGISFVTGIASSDIRFETNDVERVRIGGTSGQVGIGSTNPTSRLHVIAPAAESPLHVKANTTEAMYINLSGDTGIGTITPLSKLHILSNASQSPIKIDTQTVSNALLMDTNGRLGIGQTTMTARLDIKGLGAASTSFAIKTFNSSSATTFCVRDDNRVGVSTHTPLTNLHIQEDQNGQTGVFLVNGGTGGATQSSFLIGNSNSGGKYSYFTHFGTNWTPDGLWVANRSAYIAADTQGALFMTSNASSPFIFATGGGHAASNERLRITSTGNVGIGTTTPVNFVDIEKNQNAVTILGITNTTNGTSGRAALLLSGGSGNMLLDLRSDAYVGPHTSRGVLRTGTGVSGLSISTFVEAADIRFYIGDVEKVRINSTDGKLGVNIAAPTSRLHVIAPAAESPLHVKANTTEAMYINLSGDTGIGTITPTSKLHVSGSTSESLLHLKNGSVDTLFVTSGSSLVMGATTIPVANTFLYIKKAQAGGFIRTRLENTDTGANSSSGYEAVNGFGDLGTFGMGARTFGGSADYLAFAAFMNGPNTAIVSNATTGQTKFFVGGTTSASLRMVLDSVGKTGLNIAVPTSRLHVIAAAAESPLHIKANTIEGLYMNSTGNIGAGIITPAAADWLHVKRSSLNTAAVIKMENTDTGTNSGSEFQGVNGFGDVTNFGQGGRVGSAFGYYGEGRGYMRSSDISFVATSALSAGTGGFRWFTNTGAQGDVKMTMNNSGNLIIGGEVPLAKLHVVGSVRFKSLSGDPSIGQVLEAGDTNGTLRWVTPSSAVKSFNFISANTQTTISATSTTDTLTFSGVNLDVLTNATDKIITIVNNTPYVSAVTFNNSTLELTNSTGGTLTADIITLTGLTINGNLNISGQTNIEIPSTHLPTGTTQSIDWNDSNIQVIDLDSASGNITLTFNNAKSGAIYYLKSIQGGVSRSFIYPATVKWENGTSLTPTASDDAIDLITMLYDGTNFLASYGTNFS
jgi:hypothetical protein